MKETTAARAATEYKQGGPGAATNNREGRCEGGGTAVKGNVGRKVGGGVRIGTVWDGGR